MSSEKKTDAEMWRHVVEVAKVTFAAPERYNVMRLVGIILDYDDDKKRAEQGPMGYFFHPHVSGDLIEGTCVGAADEEWATGPKGEKVRVSYALIRISREYVVWSRTKAEEDERPSYKERVVVGPGTTVKFIIGDYFKPYFGSIKKNAEISIVVGEPDDRLGRRRWTVARFDYRTADGYMEPVNVEWRAWGDQYRYRRSES